MAWTGDAVQRTAPLTGTDARADCSKQPSYTIRPISPSDEALEAEFLERLSPRSSYQRLMSTRRPTAEEVRRWTRVDGVREVALVAVVMIDRQPRQIGVTRYARNEAGFEAEFAIVIDDEYQRQGVGRALLNALVAEARKDVHLATLSGMTMSDNIALIRLARGLGFQTGREPGHGSVTHLTLTLRTPPADHA